MDRPTCRTCIFWVADRDGFGECRKQPPMIAPLPPAWDEYRHQDHGSDSETLDQWAEDFAFNATLFPVTYEEWWCGQHDRFVKWMLDRPVEVKS